jgi:putative membrane protein
MPSSHKWVYGIYIIIWIVLAIEPKFPDDWLLENVLVFIFFPIVVWLDIKYQFSLTALSFLLLFGVLHALGAHFTYAEMEYFDSITHFFGFERNHFDRLVHFLFGALVFKPLFEIIIYHMKQLKLALLFVFTLIATISTLYELLEWVAAMLLYPELGMAYLGIQGDIWDAHKDTLVAIIGALCNITFFYWHYKKVFNSKEK